jgi:hypothetical protein
MKNCSKIHPLLALEAEGALSASDHRKVQVHLKDCAEARRELESLRRLLEAAGKLPPPPLPRNLHESIMDRLKREGFKPASKSWVFKPLWPLAAAAATAIFFFTQNPDWRQIMKGHSAPSPAAPSLEKPQAFSAAAPAQNAAPPAPEAKAFAPVASQEERDATALASHENAPAESTTRKKTMALAAPMAAGAPAVSQAQSNLMQTRALDVIASAKDLKEEAPSTWNGDQDPLYTAPSQQVLTDSDGFLKVWQALKAGEAAPSVDFTRQAVVFIETGEEPTSGYVAEILRMETKPGQLLVYYSVEMPSGAVTAQVESHPWVLKIIPRPSVPVFFQQEP